MVGLASLSERLRMTARIISHDGRPLDLNPGLSEYEAGMALDVRCDRRRPATFVSLLYVFA